MTQSLGDFDTSAVIYGKFTTYRPTTGAAFTLGGTPALSVYKDNSTTQSTTGVTLTADFDSVTGLNHYAIDTSADGTFYSAGSFFDIVITTGTVDSVSVVGAVVGSFTIRKNSSLKPATAGRTLVVDASGLADANTVKLGPSGSGTAQTARDVGGNVDAAITSRMATYTQPTGFLAATFPTGTVANTTNITAGTITTTTNLTNAPTAGDFTATMKTSLNASTPASITGAVGSVTGAVGSVTGAVGSVTGNVGGNVVGSVASVTATVNADVVKVNGDATCAANLQRSTAAITTGTVGSASTTTSIVTSALSPTVTVADQLKGRIVTFDKGTTTAALRGQATDITANTSGGVLTVTALTNAPVSGDTFTVT